METPQPPIPKSGGRDPKPQGLTPVIGWCLAAFESRFRNLDLTKTIMAQ